MNDVDLLSLPEAPYDPNEGSEWHKDKRALYIKINRWLAWFAASELLVILVLGLALAGLEVGVIPTKPQLVPLVLAINADHSFQLVRDIRELPPSKQAELTAGSAQNYVQCREEYQYQGAPYCYDLVSLMSDPHVKAEYQDHMASPNGPQQRIWDKGHIYVQVITDGIQLIDGEIPQVLVPFWLTEKMYAANEPPPSHYTATIAYRYVNRIAKAEFGFNPAALRITAYRIHCDTNCPEKP